MAQVEKALADAPVSARAHSAQKARLTNEATRRVKNACRAAHLQCIADCGIRQSIGPNNPLIEEPGECQWSCDNDEVNCIRRVTHRQP